MNYQKYCCSGCTVLPMDTTAVWTGLSEDWGSNFNDHNYKITKTAIFRQYPLRKTQVICLSYVNILVFFSVNVSNVLVNRIYVYHNSIHNHNICH